MNARHRPSPARAGFTVIEVVLGAFLMASMLLVAGLATDRCMALFRQQRAVQGLTTSANRLLQRIASEVAFARRGSLQPPTIETQGSSSLQYQRCLGVTGGAVQWSATCSLSWERESGEADNGQDDDGDGLVDEGQLVLLQDVGLASEQRIVLGHGLCEFMPGETFDGADEDGDGRIDERGLCFLLAGDVLTIQVGLQALDPDGHLLTKVVETSAFLRN